MSLFQHVTMALEFEKMMRKDERFEITHEVMMGLVCFRLKVRTCLTFNMDDHKINCWRKWEKVSCISFTTCSESTNLANYFPSRVRTMRRMLFF